MFTKNIDFSKRGSVMDKEKEKRNSQRYYLKAILFSIIFVVIGVLGGFLGALIYDKTKTPSPEIVSSRLINTSELNTADTVAVVADSVVDVVADTNVGSGVVYSKDGYIITNEHVVHDAKKIEIKLRNQKSYSAVNVGADKNNDIALLKINENNLSPVKFANYSEIRLGETIIVIGNPLGELSGSVTDGVVSSKERMVNVDGKQMKLMQTCAEINSGNSGGGVFRLNGELAGIVVAKSSVENSEGLGFAIKVPDVEDSIKKILKK